MLSGNCRTVLVRFCLLCVLLHAAGAGAAPSGPADGCRAVRAEARPDLDGLLSEPFWGQAPVYGDFTLHKGEGKRVGDTTFRFAYDDAWLYFGAECLNPGMNTLQPIVKGHDKGACNDESVELFLDPGTEGRMYFHYILTFANARDEKRVLGRNRDVLWDVPWRSATNVREDGWSAEFAIPLYVPVSYGRLSGFRINVARNQRVPIIDAQNVVVEEQRRLSIFSPIRKTFHEPDRFVPLAGIAGLKLRVPLLAQIVACRVSPFRVKDGRSSYDLDIEVKGHNQQGGELELLVSDRPVSGAPREIVKAVALDGVAVKKLKVAVPVASLCSREVTLCLRDPGRNEILETFVVEDLSSLNIMTAFLDRNYYTTEPRALAACRTRLPAETLARMALEVRDATGAVLGALSTPAPECRVGFPIGGFPLGVTRIDVVLREKGGAVFFTVSLELTKRAPNPGREWKIDQERRLVLNNGKPFFPFGVVMSGVKPGDLYAYRDLAENFSSILSGPIASDDRERCLIALFRPKEQQPFEASDMQVAESLLRYSAATALGRLGTPAAQKAFNGHLSVETRHFLRGGTH